MSRHHLLILVAFGSVLGLAAPLREAAGQATPAAGTTFSGETFVGRTSDPQTFVAIVLGDEAGGGPRPARGYLCNGRLRTIDVWLTGEMAGDVLALTAEDGSRLSGVRNAAGIGGAATLGDGTNLLFTALPVEGIAGLYTVEMLADGRMAGIAASGATLVGTLSGDGVPEAGTYSYEVVVTPPTEDAIPLEITTATSEEGEFRTIILPGGESRGQGKTRKSRDWIDPGPQP